MSFYSRYSQLQKQQSSDAKAPHVASGYSSAELRSREQTKPESLATAPSWLGDMTKNQSLLQIHSSHLLSHIRFYSGLLSRLKDMGMYHTYECYPLGLKMWVLGKIQRSETCGGCVYHWQGSEFEDRWSRYATGNWSMLIFTSGFIIYSLNFIRHFQPT